MKIKNDLYIKLNDYLAIGKENCEEIKINKLLDKAESKNHIPDEELARKLFTKASLYNYPSVITFLTDNGFNPNFAERGNFTPLHLAAANNNHESVLALLAGGADQRALDRMNRTPAELAISNGFEYIAQRIERSPSPQTSTPPRRATTYKKQLDTIIEEDSSLEKTSNNDEMHLPPINLKSKKTLTEVNEIKKSLFLLKEKAKSTSDLGIKLPPIGKILPPRSV